MRTMPSAISLNLLLSHVLRYFLLMAEESCAACGNASSNLKGCTACKLVKYCGRECQVAHRSAHKKACRIRAAELFDVKLFADPPRREDCPICMIMLPPDGNEITYMPCCGKFICSGCIVCLTRDVCPFCNTPCHDDDDDEEYNTRLLRRIERFNDPAAIHQLGSLYYDGDFGFPVNHSKAVEFYQKASELGYPESHLSLGNVYEDGDGVQVDTKKAIHHFQIAAMMGNNNARYNLGIYEAKNNRNVARAIKHYTIAAKCGHDESLEIIKDCMATMAIVSKTDFESILSAYEAAKDEVRSEERDRSNAARLRAAQLQDD